MSSRDHDLVQPAAAHEPARSVPASPRRDLVEDEDADASFTRKRPRLDSGTTPRAAMSADPVTPENTAAEPPEKQLEMTIRSHPPSSPARPVEDLQSAQESPILLPSHDQVDNEDPGSPPVMVIDDEDDEPVAFTVQLDAEDHFRQFPFARLGNYSHMVRELAQHINTGMGSPPLAITLNRVLC